MADFADTASDLTEQSMQVILANHKAKQSLLSRHFCVDCGIEIPAARRKAAKGCTRCTDCQDIAERKGLA